MKKPYYQPSVEAVQLHTAMQICDPSEQGNLHINSTVVSGGTTVSNPELAL